MVLVGQGSAGNIVTELSDFEVTADDRLQFRVFAATGGSGRTLVFSVQFKNASGANLGSALTQTLSITPANTWKSYSFQMDPPDGARGATLTVTKPQSGAGVYVTRFDATTVNIAIEARLTELEAAWVDPNGAFLTFQRNINARVGEAETDISDEVDARVQGDSALGTRINNLTTTVGQQGTRISTAETAIATANDAIAQSRQELEAQFGSLQMVKNPNFSQDLAHWAGNSAMVVPFTVADRIVVRNRSNQGSALIRNMPNQKGYRIYGSDPFNARATSNRFEVVPAAQYTLSFLSFITAGTPRPRVIIRYFRADGSVFAGPFLNATEDSNGVWFNNVKADIVVPDDAVECDLQIVQIRDGMSGWCAVTGITFTRQEAYDSWSKAQIDINAVSYADINRSFNQYKIDMTARLGGIDDAIDIQSRAINQMYTKAETDRAISAALIEVSAMAGEASAYGRFRVTAESTPSDAIVRIGLAARAQLGEVAATAAMFLEALTNGQGSRISFVADRFAVVSSVAAGAVKVVPFYVKGANTYIKTAMIETAEIKRGHISELAVDTLRLGDNAATMSWGTNSNVLTLNLAYVAQLTIICNARIAGVNNTYSLAGDILLDGASIERGNLSVSQYTWRNTMIKTVTVPAGRHTIRQRYDRETDVSEFRISVIGCYK